MQADSPEERLLRLIRKKDKDKGGHKRSAGKISPLSSIAETIFLKSKIFKPNYFKQVNALLIILLVSIAMYLFYAIIFVKVDDIDSVLKKTESPRPLTTEAEKEIAPAGREDYSYYSKDIGSKELFGASAIGGDGKAVTDADLRKRFTLVGILPGDKPQAIIEDKEAQKTHYLFKGESFNGVTVEEIESGRVKLDYDGKKIELVL